MSFSVRIIENNLFSDLSDEHSINVFYVWYGVEKNSPMARGKFVKPVFHEQNDQKNRKNVVLDMPPGNTFNQWCNEDPVPGIEKSLYIVLKIYQADRPLAIVELEFRESYHSPISVYRQDLINRLQTKPESVIIPERSELSPPLTLAFFHIYCNNFTMSILDQQIGHIIFSGLYDNINQIYCFLVGEPQFIHSVYFYLQTCGRKFVIAAMGENDTSYERFTLTRMPHYIQPQDKILYFHSKGITKPFSKPVQDWRQYMEYYLMRHHVRCVELLDTYDCVGVNWSIHSKPHFSGNFWWATGAYFLRLPKTIGPDYHDPEFYIGLENPKYFCLHDSKTDHYLSNFDFSNFIDLEI